MKTIEGIPIKINTFSASVGGGTAGNVIFPALQITSDGAYNAAIFNGLTSAFMAKIQISRGFIPLSLTHAIYKTVAPNFSSNILNQFTTPYLVPILYQNDTNPKFEVMPSYFNYAVKIAAQAFTNNNYLFVPGNVPNETYIFQGEIILNTLSQLDFSIEDFLLPNDYLIVPTDQKSSYMNFKYNEGQKNNQYQNGLISRANSGAGITSQYYTFTYLTI